MDQIRIFRCEDSIDGIFTAVYQAWSARIGHQNIRIEEEGENSYSNFQLFSDYVRVETDYELSAKVGSSIKKKISQDAYEVICKVALSNHVGKGDLIYRFMVLGFHMGKNIMDCFHDEMVGSVLKISGYVGKEVHFLHGFIRFSEIENKYLYSTIHPKNNVVSLLMPHFVDRLPTEAFLIYDEVHKQVGLHAPGKEWVVLKDHLWNHENLKNRLKEQDTYENLWKIFFKQIAIKERSNYKLQRNMLPLRFREDMTEFNS